jgi:hypothetical protein
LGGLVRSVAKQRTNRENDRKKTLAARRNATRSRPGRQKKC